MSCTIRFLFDQKIQNLFVLKIEIINDILTNLERLIENFDIQN